jgi:hypothetical protein
MRLKIALAAVAMILVLGKGHQKRGARHVSQI